MPYRRLPNTDQARLRALQTAVTMGQKKETEQLAFSDKSLNHLRSFYTSFESTIIHHKLARTQQEKSATVCITPVAARKDPLRHLADSSSRVLPGCGDACLRRKVNQTIAASDRQSILEEVPLSAQGTNVQSKRTSAGH